MVKITNILPVCKLKRKQGKFPLEFCIFETEYLVYST